MTRLIFVRHGQSEGNLKRIFTGQLDLPLTELGREQAGRTSNYLYANYAVDAIYSSDLCRSMETARASAELLGLEVIPEEGLREFDVGAWGGLTYVQLLDQYPSEYDAWHNDFGRVNPTNGEKFLAFSKRIFAAVDHILEENRDRCVAIFTHATPIRLIYAQSKGIAPSELQFAQSSTNASVSIFDYDEKNKPHLFVYSYDAHQTNAKSTSAANLV